TWPDPTAAGRCDERCSCADRDQSRERDDDNRMHQERGLGGGMGRSAAAPRLSRARRRGIRRQHPHLRRPELLGRRRPDHRRRGLMVMPGLIDIHAHPGHEASYRGIREEHGVPEMYMSGLFERGGAYWPDEEGRLACAEAAYCELLASGVTTLVDISPLYPGWVELMARSGLRGVLAPGYASARWVVRRSHLLEYEWNEAAGRQKFEAALRLCDELATHPSGRLSGMVSP